MRTTKTIFYIEFAKIDRKFLKMTFKVLKDQDPDSFSFITAQILCETPIKIRGSAFLNREEKPGNSYKNHKHDKHRQNMTM